MKRVLGLSILVAICHACGGSSSPLAPSRQSVTESAATSGFGIVVGSPPTGAPAANLTECLRPFPAQACFPPLPVRPRDATASSLSAPINLNASASGSSVTLTWAASGLVDAYIIEAGSSSGLANLANFSTGNALTTFQASGIGAGTYYVRVRAIGSGGISAPSNEAVLVVGGGPCVAPGAPSGLSVVSLSGSTVVLSWSASAGNPTSYVVEAGSLSGLSNLANSDLGSAGTSLTATGVGNGTYYVRIRAKNGCGASGPSNEIILTVGSTPTPRTTFGAGRYLVGSDIVAGRYFTNPAYACYWERLSGLGGTTNEIIANDFIGFDSSQAIVDILSMDRAFSTEPDCGTWFINAPRWGLQTNIPQGTWLVGTQVTAGTYRANAQYGCYWQRLRNFTGVVSSGVIANNFAESAGQQLVTIAAGDAGFSTDNDCGTWTPVSGLTTAQAPMDAAQSPSEIERQWNMNRQRLREKTSKLK